MHPMWWGLMTLRYADVMGWWYDKHDKRMTSSVNEQMLSQAYMGTLAGVIWLHTCACVSIAHLLILLELIIFGLLISVQAWDKQVTNIQCRVSLGLICAGGITRNSFMSVAWLSFYWQTLTTFMDNKDLLANIMLFMESTTRSEPISCQNNGRLMCL